ncbi:MAG TPA: TIGR04053 family radical SAM/SPASM domain-containing protein [Bryobacteraceae bacterium]|nr:TIGR04053 family radical SAM/SPASM domain-containing protein [Bryobacteraceae bacterium]
MDFNLSPLLVVWEATQACDLACVHCRPTGQSDRNPDELSTAEGYRLIEETKEFGNPLLVIAGGDPFKRPDLFDLIRHSVEVGLRTNITPSATPLLTLEAIDQLKASGISRMAIGLDGPDAPTHDGIRGVEGTYDRAMNALIHAREIGLETQVLTNVSRANLSKLAHIAERVGEVRSKMWSLFFPVGRDEQLSGAEYEKIFEFLYEISKVAPFEVKTTEALHYRRYTAQRLKAEHGGRGGTNGRMLWRTTAVGEGRGFLFVSHTGAIFPSGFLPVSAGNVRTDSIVDVYRNSSLFRSLRTPEASVGKCGYCEYGKLCGGSRARAYAFTGDYLEGDPCCVYQPSERSLATDGHG